MRTSSKEIEDSKPAVDAILLDLVCELASELRGPRRETTFALDSSLERDVGIDSLGRMELLLRIEHRFGVTLTGPRAVLAETPRDLVREIEAARPRASSASPATLPIQPPPLAPDEGCPERAATIPEALDWHVARHAARPCVTLYAEDDQLSVMTYADLLLGAEKVAAGLRAYDLNPGQTVALMLPTSLEYFYGFYGILLAGGIPVPIYPPHRLTQIEEHVRRQVSILSNAQAFLLITMPEAKKLAPLLKSLLPDLRGLVTGPDLVAHGGHGQRIKLTSPDIALLQYTSGSTGNPKGVVLTHENLLANIRGMGVAVNAGSSDIFVSWLPLYHDMGLIGACLATLYYGMPLVLMSPLAFLARPQRWLWAIHEHRGTLAAAPNFAYEICARRIPESELAGLDLGSWRLAFNGAEQVSPDTIRRFSERFRPYGFRPEAMTPVYGLAESSLGLTFPPRGRGPRIDRIESDSFVRQGRAMPVAGDDGRALRMVSCGRPMPAHEVRIVDETGGELGERENGRLQFRGPSATAGYYRNRQATKELFHGPWLDSGDRAYTAEGEIFVTGREKDVIIRGGRNLFPFELEQAVGEIPGIRKGCVAVFGSPDPTSGTERIIVLAETNEAASEKAETLRRQITQLATDLLTVPPDEVVLVPPHAIPKTSSGKIRRSACRDLFKRGEIGRRRAVWWQIVRLSLLSVRPRLRRIRRQVASVLYGTYAWLLFLILLPPTWLGVMLLPRRSWRRTLARLAARGLFSLTGIPVSVLELKNLSLDRPYIVVVNHASYLDAFALIATLPSTISFVAKGELRGNPWIHRPLQRLGYLFIERADAQRSVEELDQMIKAVNQGMSLLFFPEGTFRRAAGLGMFRMGAFIVASQTGVPVLPVALRGTRSILRDGQWLPKRGEASITISAPITPAGAGWSEALRLRDAARASILGYCGEPDLIQEM
ncbi:MAG: AMP-binding protein [Acidobacteria bacterium]|nr:AMP-binding protein [Acidobacteriota bacterium]MBI3655948.1 AMP-binding protein [Acidobacteriota bacterium]